MKYIKSLTFKIGLLITLVEALFFVILGAFYSIRYVNQLEISLEKAIAMPGRLISQGLLDYDSVTDLAVIEDITGFEPLEAYIIGLNMNVFYSLDPKMIGLSVDDIPTLNSNMFSISASKITIVDKVIDGIPSKSCIIPVYSFDQVTPTLFTYIRIDSQNIETERLRIVHSFILGFLICIILTNLTVVIIFKIYIYKRLDESLVVMEKVENGDLTARLKISRNSDELSYLQHGINQMIYKLQLQVSDLNNEMIARKKQESEKESILLALTESTKMAELGALSAGIAHEFKNPISGILMTIQNIQTRLMNTDLNKNIEVAQKYNLSLKDVKSYVEDRKIYEMIATIEKISDDMNQIIGNMLSYSRKTDTPCHLCDIHEIMDEVLILARFNQSFRSIGEVDIIYGEDIPEIECYKNEIIQVFLNILNNGAEAILNNNRDKEKYSSALTINIDSNETNVIVQIKDNGPGILPDVQERLFEPFYTTKADGGGTGLGLYICKIIVEEKHSGKLTFVSEVREGTIFTIVLPIKKQKFVH